MRVTQKLALIDKIARELQERYTFEDIDSFFAEYRIITAGGSWSSKWAYAKACLAGTANTVLLEIAEELEIASVSAGYATVTPPRNWKNVSGLRLFISHISADKTKATRLKECLADYAISGFVAHEDIEPTLEWQNEIERGLQTMDALVAMHTLGFSKSFWTQQEIGFARGRGVKIISVRMGEDPTGFISKHQALPRQNRTAEQIALEIDKLLEADPRTSAKLREAKDALPF